jgi:hypothetical protein
LGLFHQRLGQVQLNRNAHAVHNMAASPLACQLGKRSLLAVSLSIPRLSFGPRKLRTVKKVLLICRHLQQFSKIISPPNRPLSAPR